MEESPGSGTLVEQFCGGCGVEQFCGGCGVEQFCEGCRVDELDVGWAAGAEFAVPV